MGQTQTESLRESAPAPESSPVVEVAETGAEKNAEQAAEDTRAPERSEPVAEKPVMPLPVPVHVAPVIPQDRLVQEIEDILEEDLKELYLAMPKEKRAAFKVKGEETISLVRQLLQATHVNVKKIFQLIRAWLTLIPGVNRYFLEQEAKIKTDKIILVSGEEKKRSGSKDLL